MVIKEHTFETPRTSNSLSQHHILDDLITYAIHHQTTTIH